MTRRLAILLFGALVLCASAQAGDLAATRIISGDEIGLSDERVVRLQGIKANIDATTYLESTVKNHALVLQDATTDRYGRMSASVFVDGEAHSLQQDLLDRGLAFVYPCLGDEPHLDEMLQVEHTARLGKRGMWADAPDVSSDDAGKLYGHYGFVTGTITKAERVKNKVYLNFGADWRTDFTVTIVAHDLRAFKKADLDPLTLQGKRIRARGWIKRDYGPMITVTDPHQLELL